MLFQRINRSDPEKVFLVVKAGEDLKSGRPVCMHFSGTDDGLVGWLANAASDVSAVVGIADADITSGEYGLVQCYGYRSAAKAICASNFTIANLAIMVPHSTGSGLLSMSASIGASTVAQPSFIAAVSASSVSSDVSATGGTDLPVFIRCM